MTSSRPVRRTSPNDCALGADIDGLAVNPMVVLSAAGLCHTIWTDSTLAVDE